MKLNIKVYPKAKKQELEKISETEYKAYLKSLPENNKANIELLKLLKKELKMNHINLIKGRTSKNKIIEVR